MHVFNAGYPGNAWLNMETSTYRDVGAIIDSSDEAMSRVDVLDGIADSVLHPIACCC